MKLYQQARSPVCHQPTALHVPQSAFHFMALPNHHHLRFKFYMLGGMALGFKPLSLCWAEDRNK